MRRHPSRKRLERWFDGHEADPDLDAHLDTCDRCASVIEELAASDDPVHSALQSVLPVPDDLHARIEVGINSRLQNRQDLAALAEIMGIGLRTARLVFADPEPDDIPPEEHDR